MGKHRHVIESALDFARMPALGLSSVVPPLPADIVEIMRIAAAHPKACQDASDATGEPAHALIEAARFYLQQLLFRPEADCYRILGLRQGASRVTARTHMRWLLQWLHPDRNDRLEAVYAERVVKAWREFSASSGSSKISNDCRHAARGADEPAPPFRVPWIENPNKGSRLRGRSAYLTMAVWVIPGLLVVLVALSSALYFFGFGSTLIGSLTP